MSNFGRAINRSRWTEHEDDFLRAYFGALGDFVGVHDLGRAPGAAARRVKQLKRWGKWKKPVARQSLIKPPRA